MCAMVVAVLQALLTHPVLQPAGLSLIDASQEGTVPALHGILDLAFPNPAKGKTVDPVITDTLVQFLRDLAAMRGTPVPGNPRPKPA